MDNITIGQFSVFMAGLVALCGSIGYFLKPIKSFQERLEKVEQHQDNDNKRLAQLETDSKMQLKVLLAMLSHMETGNSTNQMRTVKKELEDYIINK